jgi:hypothetical protein
LGVAEALPNLRSRVGVFSRADAKVKEACAQAITKLETLASLPRAAQDPVLDLETLPRSAATPQPETETLPRPTNTEWRTK